MPIMFYAHTFVARNPNKYLINVEIQMYRLIHAYVCVFKLIATWLKTKLTISQCMA